MPQVKMRYGIDLGTTNSAICRMENGSPVIKKTDTLKDTLPSCVAFTRKKVVKVGDSAYNDLRQDKARATKHWANNKENVFLEFKRTMGLDTLYKSSFMERGFSSEELSAEVLKTLKTFVAEDSINAAVITIPAKFKTDQIAATKRAAQLAGIDHCELLQEPIAASMAYGLNTENKNGTWLVFDFGGGTFDVALISVQEGVMQVVDTEGDNYLGGKNLDYAVVDEIIIPYLQENFTIDEILDDEGKKAILRNAMKFYAEQAKNQLSFKDKADITSQLDEFGEDDEGVPLELDLVITQSELEDIFTPIFQKAINITKELLKRNNLKGADVDSLILVGGPTHSPILRGMLKNQITQNVDTSIDPMTAVAAGAALYASGIDCSVEQSIKRGTIALEVSYQSSSVESSEYVAVKLLPTECKGHLPEKTFVEFTRNDKAWSSGKVEINDIGEVVECQLIQGKANAFSINAYDEKGNAIPCFPDEINIMQGIVVGNAVLPYHIGIEVRNELRNRDEFVPLKGLEKNQTIPAVGVRNDLKNPHQLRPGMSADRLVIPIYQGEHNAEHTSAIYNDHVFDVVITGDDVPEVIPADSAVDITIKVDASQMMKVEVNFPSIGESIEKEVDVKQRKGVQEADLEEKLDQANDKIDSLQQIEGVTEDDLTSIQTELDDISNRFEGEKTSEDGKMHLLADLRRVFLKMEKIEKDHEWDALESKLRNEYDRLDDANTDLGHKYDKEVASMHSQVDLAIREKNVTFAHTVLEDMHLLFIRVTLVYQMMGWLKSLSRSFNQYKWKDSARARNLLNQALAVINDNPTAQTLRPYCAEIYELMDEKDIGISDKIKF